MFPIIEHINDVLPAIEGRQEFRVIEKSDYKVIDYLVNMSDTFPDPLTAPDEKTAKNWLVRRECRGIIFSANTGKIIRRVYAKFFNINEREETLAYKIDITRPHVILSKLDGSMIVPFYSEKQIKFGTKKGVTDVSAMTFDFLSKNPHYVAWSKAMIDSGYSPIYEFCSRKQKIVLDYPVDRLVLTAVRHMITGEFIPYQKMLDFKNQGIEVVFALPGNIENMNSFIEDTKTLENEEGYVIRFSSGKMYKTKADKYCLIHSTKEMINLEKNVISTILSEKMDDTKALMSPEDRHKVDVFEKDLHENIFKTADRLKWLVIAAKDNLNSSKKRFALEIVQPHKVAIERGLLFKIWDYGENQAVKIVSDYILQHCGTATQVDEVRTLFGGISWYSYFNEIPLDD